jgi:hypothetical protein
MTKPKTIPLEIVSASSASSAVETLGLRRDRILHYHTSVIRAFSQQMGYAFLCGLELNAAKAEIAHGAFEKWREQNLPALPKRTACRYSLFATALQENCTAISKLTERAQLLLTNGDFEDADRTELLQAVHDATDGKTLTELYRDLGVIRDPIAQKDRARGEPVKLTAEDRQRLNVEFTHRLAGDARTWRNTAAIHGDCQAADLDILLDELVATTTFIRQLKRARRSKGSAPRAARREQASEKQHAKRAARAAAKWAKHRAQKGTAK